MNLLLALLLSLLFAAPVQAFMLPLMGSGGGGSSYSDIIFWAGFEDAGGTTLETSNCNSGTATEWTLNDATIDDTSKLAGDYGLNSSDLGHNATLSLDSDYFTPAKGAIGFRLKIDTWYNDNSLFIAKNAGGSNSIYIVMTSGSEVRGVWYYNSSAQVTVTTTDAGLTTGTLYYIVLKWDQTAPSMEIHAYDSSGTELGTAGTSTSSMTAMSDIATGSMVPGESYENGTSVYYLDTIVCFDGSVTRTAQEYADIVRNNATCPR